MKAVLQALNKTPGVLGSAYIADVEEVSDFGESIGVAEGLDLSRRSADAAAEWAAKAHEPLEGAVFIGTAGRIVVRMAGKGVLVAFAENDSAAGLLKIRMREAAATMAVRDSSDGQPAA